MKVFLYFALSSLLLTGCFKDEPKKEMMRAAGAWNMERAERIEYAEDGTVLSETSTTDLGVLMLNHNDDFLYEGTFSLSFNQTFVDWNTEVTKRFGDANIWYVTVGANQFGMALKDYETGFVSNLGNMTISKLTSKKMVFYNITLHPNSNIKSLETWYLKR